MRIRCGGDGGPRCERDATKAVRTASPRTAFTLIELLVVIAITALLIALVIPAVHWARSGARVAVCKQNLKTLGQASMQHIDANGHYPTGGWGAQWIGDPDRGFGPKQPGGWPYNLLDFTENSLLRTLGAGLTGSALKDALTECIQTPVPVFHCPSRRRANLYPSWNAYGHEPPFNCNDVESISKIDYAANSGDQITIEFPFPESIAEGDGGYAWPDTSKMTGIVFQRSTVTPEMVIDGLSATYLIGEKYVAADMYQNGLSNGDHHGLYAGQCIESLRSTHVDYPPIVDRKSVDYFRRFGSTHAGGWNVVFCDGSVHTIGYSIDSEIHRRQGNRKDTN